MRLSEIEERHGQNAPLNNHSWGGRKVGEHPPPCLPCLNLKERQGGGGEGHGLRKENETNGKEGKILFSFMRWKLMRSHSFSISSWLDVTFSADILKGNCILEK